MITTSIEQARHLLQQNQVVGVPTETVYGLAANAYADEAVKKIFIAKGRPTYHPLIVHIFSKAQLQEFTHPLSPKLELLIDRYWPGPLTLLLPKAGHLLSPSVTAGLTDVAVRMPAHPMMRRLLKQLAFPLVAPSANPFGYISPTCAAHVAESLGEQIPLILDGGSCSVGVESTLVGLDHHQRLILHRPGVISKQDLEKVWPGQVLIAPPSDRPQASGTLKHHYAPRTPLIRSSNRKALVEDLKEAQQAGHHVGLLLFQEQVDQLPLKDQTILSPDGDLAEAASKLFAAMRALDQRGFDLLLTEYFPAVAQGIAINDRVARASSKHQIV